MAQGVLMPKAGITVESCIIGEWLKQIGDDVKVGDIISVPGIGDVEVLPNDSIAEGDTTGDVNNGVVLLPERAVFNADNMNNYNF